MARDTVTNAVRVARLATDGGENLTREQLEARVYGLRAKVRKLSGAVRALQRRLADAALPANLPGPDEIDAARSSIRASKRKRHIVKTQLARQLVR